MHIDFKITVWERVMIPDEIAEDVLAKIKDKKIRTSVQLYDTFVEKTDKINWDTLPETEEAISPEENEGCSTIEVYDEYNELLWDNAIKKE